MTSSSYVVYVDESGDEGFGFGGGSSRWFVLSGVVLRKSNELETVKLVDQVRTLLGRPEKKPLHFRDLRHEHRLPYLERIARAPLRAVNILIHKPSILEPETFRESNRLYFYAVRLMLERISWLCRDRRRDGDGDGTAEIAFSNRSGMSYNELREYLRRLAERPTNIFWEALRCEEIAAFSAGRRMGLQIADAFASSFFKAVEPNRFGHTEDRYVKLVRPVLYRSKGSYRGYGVKVWPRDSEVHLPDSEALRAILSVG